jgi:prevent-host-death family protein
METVGINTLRTNLRAILTAVRNGTPTTITDFRDPVAVLVKIEDYERLKADSAELRSLKRKARP